jgi:LysR family glycine cleavage system transcriptional activator
MKLRDLPLFAIRAFTVTAQTGSVGKAAEELAVTHGAVSRQLSNLEEWLGHPLFIREGRKLRLTPVGARLAAQTGESLGDLISVCIDLRGVPKRRQISIVGPATFTMNWLMPRIEAYEKIDSNVDIWLKTRMANERLDFNNTDLVVTRDFDVEPKGPPLKRVILLDELLTVMASPEFIRSRGISEPKDILSHPRIAALTRPADWANWLERAMLDDAPESLRHRFDHQFVAMHATRAGIGSIVAPINLFGEIPDLLAPFPELTLRGLPYVLYHRVSEPIYVRRFVTWLSDQATESA